VFWEEEEEEGRWEEREERAREMGVRGARDRVDEHKHNKENE
jgi:hypothetical protein